MRIEILALVVAGVSSHECNHPTDENSWKFCCFDEQDDVLYQGSPVAFELDGVDYSSAEKYMMATKAVLLGDFKGSFNQILVEDDAAKLKKLGRNIGPFNGPVWSRLAEGVVYDGNMAKFYQNEDARNVLMDTEGFDLLFASEGLWGALGKGSEDRNLMTDCISGSSHTLSGPNKLGRTIQKIRGDYGKLVDAFSTIRESGCAEDIAIVDAIEGFLQGRKIDCRHWIQIAADTVRGGAPKPLDGLDEDVKNIIIEMAERRVRYCAFLSLQSTFNGRLAEIKPIP